MTQLKLQKLVYYAQSWALALLDRPLFDEDFQAWRHGPVAASVYQRYNRYGWNAIPTPTWEPQIDEAAQRLLEDIHQIYGGRQASELEKLSHEEQPWEIARRELPPAASSRRIIRKEDMKRFYSQMFERTGGAMVPHVERFDSVAGSFRKAAGSVSAPADQPRDAEDAEFDRSVMSGLAGIYDEFYAASAPRG